MLSIIRYFPQAITFWHIFENYSEPWEGVGEATSPRLQTSQEIDQSEKRWEFAMICM